MKILSFTILVSISVLLTITNACSNDEQSCTDKLDSLSAMIVEYKIQDKQKNDLVLEFNQKLDEYGSIQDSIEIREKEINKLKASITRKGYASRSDSKQLNKILSEIDGFLEENKDMAMQFDSTNYKNANQEQIVKILLRNIKDKQDQINQLKTSVKVLQTQVRGLKVDNKNLIVKTNILEQKADSLEQKTNEMISKANQITLYNYNISLPKNTFGKTKKAKKIDVFNICFTLNKNEFAKTEIKTVYVRVIKPNNKLIYSSSNNLFLYKGKQIAYTTTEQILYDKNKKNKKCINWYVPESLNSGNYVISLYIDGYLLDEKTINLR